MTLRGHLADPKVAHWLIDPGSKERNLHGMVTHYVPHEASLLEGIHNIIITIIITVLSDA